MNDDILSVKFGAFAMIIKRRTLLYSILVCAIGILTIYMANIGKVVQLESRKFGHTV